MVRLPLWPSYWPLVPLFFLLLVVVGGLVVAALQPGTVASALSQPFVASGALAPETSVMGMLKALDELPACSGAHFVDYQGQSIPW